MENTGQFQDILDDESINFESHLDYEVSKLLKKTKLKISVAESVTGGMLGQRFSTLPGSSEYFLGGVISYHTKLKIKLCGVSPNTIKEKTVISEEVALEMARGVRKITNSDMCISTTGVAGPADDNYGNQLVGKVCVGFVMANNEKAKTFQFTGTRESIRKQTTQAVMLYLKQYLMNV